MTNEQRAASMWLRIEEKIRRIDPTLLETLPVGASTSVLRHVENELGMALPGSVTAIFRVHDGIGMPAAVDNCYCASFMYSLKDALVPWGVNNQVLQQGGFSDFSVTDASRSVRPVWWSRGWLPVTGDGAGNHYCIDLNPAPGGTPGQVIGFWHEDGDRTLVAPDLATFLIEHVDIHEWADMQNRRRASSR